MSSAQTQRLSRAGRAQAGRARRTPGGMRSAGAGRQLALEGGLMPGDKCFFQAGPRFQLRASGGMERVSVP